MPHDIERLDGTVRCLSVAGFHRMAYGEWAGPWTEGPPVVCVHGLTRNGRDFDPLALALAGDLKRRVICPDVVGRGRSDWLSDPKLYGYPQYLSDMVALLARLDCDHVDWVGTSMGGLIGLLLAAQPGSPIRRLVLNDVGPLVRKSGLERIAGYVGKDPVFDDMAALESYLRYVLAGFGNLTAEQWRHLAQHSYRERSDGSLGLAYDPGIAAAFTTGPLTDVDLWSLWDRITCPVLVIRGENSDILDADTAAAMTQRGPKAQRVDIPLTAHAPALMDPMQIGVIERFLSA